MSNFGTYTTILLYFIEKTCIIKNIMKKETIHFFWVLSELWVLLEKADVKISAFSFILFILIFGYLW